MLPRAARAGPAPPPYATAVGSTPSSRIAQRPTVLAGGDDSPPEGPKPSSTRRPGARAPARAHRLEQRQRRLETRAVARRERVEHRVVGGIRAPPSLSAAPAYSQRADAAHAPRAVHELVGRGREGRGRRRRRRRRRRSLAAAGGGGSIVERVGAALHWPRLPGGHGRGEGVRVPRATSVAQRLERWSAVACWPAREHAALALLCAVVLSPWPASMSASSSASATSQLPLRDARTSLCSSSLRPARNERGTRQEDGRADSENRHCCSWQADPNVTAPP